MQPQTTSKYQLPILQEEVTARIEKIADLIMTPDVKQNIEIDKIMTGPYKLPIQETSQCRFIRLMFRIIGIAREAGCGLHFQEKYSDDYNISWYEYNKLPKRFRNLFLTNWQISNPDDKRYATLKAPTRYRIIFKNKNSSNTFNGIMNGLVGLIIEIGQDGNYGLSGFEISSRIMRAEQMLLQLGNFIKIMPAKPSPLLNEYFRFISRKDSIINEYNNYQTSQDCNKKHISQLQEKIKEIEAGMQESHQCRLNYIKEHFKNTKLY